MWFHPICWPKTGHSLYSRSSQQYVSVWVLNRWQQLQITSDQLPSRVLHRSNCGTSLALCCRTQDRLRQVFKSNDLLGTTLLSLVLSRHPSDPIPISLAKPVLDDMRVQPEPISFWNLFLSIWSPSRDRRTREKRPHCLGTSAVLIKLSHACCNSTTDNFSLLTDHQHRWLNHQTLQRYLCPNYCGKPLGHSKSSLYSPIPW